MTGRKKGTPHGRNPAGIEKERSPALKTGDAEGIQRMVARMISMSSGAMSTKRNPDSNKPE